VSNPFGLKGDCLRGFLKAMGQVPCFALKTGNWETSILRL
jgi:hypothetical protein